VFMLFTMANCGLPGTSGFVGELLALMAAFKANTWAAVFATTGVILSAAYALWLYRRVVFGVLEKDSLKAITDLDRREIAILAPLVILTLLFGFYPAPVLDMSAAAVGNLVAQTKAALAPAKAALLGVQ
jgi:NADH-quinone oxidoreductase subunit M